MGTGSSIHSSVPPHIRKIITKHIKEKVKPLTHRGYFAYPFKGKQFFYKINEFKSSIEAREYRNKILNSILNTPDYTVCHPLSAIYDDNFVISRYTLHEYDLFDYASTCSFSDLGTVLLSLVEAVCHIHSAGIVHCDIKPENVLVTNTKQAILCDLDEFGVPTGLKTIGTEYYAPPIGLFREAVYMAKMKQATWYEVYAMLDLYALGQTISVALQGHKQIENVHMKKFWQTCCELMLSGNLRYFFTDGRRKIRTCDVYKIMRYYNVKQTRLAVCDCAHRKEDYKNGCNLCKIVSVQDVRLVSKA